MAENRENLENQANLCISIITLFDELDDVSDLNEFLKEFHECKFQKYNLNERNVRGILKNPSYLRKILDKLFTVLISKGWNKSTALSWDLLIDFLSFQNEEEAFIYLLNIFSSEIRLHKSKRLSS